jgi:hypothetical protein
VEIERWALLGLAAFAAGTINSVAGGGSLVSFPAAMALGMSPIVANATNSVALTPGSLTAAWAYRRELDWGILRRLLGPSLVGGLAGSLLLLNTPQQVFDAIVPLLLLGATSLLFYQNLRSAPAASAGGESAGGARVAGPWFVAAQLAVSVYGGYFGAGMGIVMLALFERLGGLDMNRKNALKTVLGVAINGAASIWFLLSGVVDLRAALVMAATSSVGGWAGAAVARRLSPRVVRWVVVGVGATLTVAQAWKRWR